MSQRQNYGGQSGKTMGRTPASMPAKTAFIPRGRAWHGRGTTWHGKTNPLKTKKNNTTGSETPIIAEKAFIYKDLKETDSLLRQVCRKSLELDGFQEWPISRPTLDDVTKSRSKVILRSHPVQGRQPPPHPVALRGREGRAGSPDQMRQGTVRW